MAQSPEIRRARKESNFYRVISQLFIQLAKDEPQLHDMFINRVLLSPSYSSCTVFMYLPGGQEAFNEKLGVLKLYKPSIRNAISKLIPGRYTPEIIFRYDQQYEKQREIDQLLTQLIDEKDKQ